jgi:hypothetical protein
MNDLMPLETSDHWADDKHGCLGCDRPRGKWLSRHCRDWDGETALRVRHARGDDAELRCFVTLPKTGS